MPVERQREYETIYILRPDAAAEDVSTIRERVEGVIGNEGGHLLKFDDWGSRKLAYEIKDKAEGRRFERGVYHYYRYMVPSGTVAELERNKGDVEMTRPLGHRIRDVASPSIAVPQP